MISSFARSERHLTNKTFYQRPGRKIAMTEFRYPDDCTSDKDIADFWAVRFDGGDLDRAEQVAFDHWLAASPQNLGLLDRARQTWRSMEIVAADAKGPAGPLAVDQNRSSHNLSKDMPRALDQTDLDGIRDDLERLGALGGGPGRLPGMRPVNRKFRPVLAVATLMVIVGLFVFGAVRPDPDLMAEKSANAISQIHDLPDGSQIWMEPGTRLNIDYTPEFRDITVLQGGIYIKVAKDASRPLRVGVGDLVARAVGTEFAASNWAGHPRVEVREGVVDVLSGDLRLAQLSAGHAAWQGTQGDMRYGAYSIDRLAAWRNGRWIAEDMPLEELLAKITPLIADETYVFDPLLDDVYVTGSFDLSKPQSAIAAVLGAYALKKQSFPGGFEIISKK